MEASLEASMLGVQTNKVMVLAKAGRVQGEGRKSSVPRNHPRVRKRPSHRVMFPRGGFQLN